MRSEYRGNKVGIVFLVVIGILVSLLVSKAYNMISPKDTSVSNDVLDASNESGLLDKYSKSDILIATSMKYTDVSFYLVRLGKTKTDEYITTTYVTNYNMYTSLDSTKPLATVDMIPHKDQSYEIYLTLLDDYGKEVSVMHIYNSIDYSLTFIDPEKGNPTDIIIEHNGECSYVSNRLLSDLSNDMIDYVSAMIGSVLGVANNYEYTNSYDQYYAYVDRLSDVPNVQD